MCVYQAVLTHESPLVGKTLADPVFSTLYHATAVGVRAPKITAGQWVVASPSGEETAFWVALSTLVPLKCTFWGLQRGKIRGWGGHGGLVGAGLGPAVDPKGGGGYSSRSPFLW